VTWSKGKKDPQTARMGGEHYSARYVINGGAKDTPGAPPKQRDASCSMPGGESPWGPGRKGLGEKLREETDLQDRLPTPAGGRQTGGIVSAKERGGGKNGVKRAQGLERWELTTLKEGNKWLRCWKNSREEGGVSGTNQESDRHVSVR